MFLVLAHLFQSINDLMRHFTGKLSGRSTTLCCSLMDGCWFSPRTPLHLWQHGSNQEVYAKLRWCLGPFAGWMFAGLAEVRPWLLHPGATDP